MVVDVLHAQLDTGNIAGVQRGFERSGEGIYGKRVAESGRRDQIEPTALDAPIVFAAGVKGHALPW